MSDALKVRVSTTQNFIGNDTTTVFTLNNEPQNIFKVTVSDVVVVNYTISGSNIIFAESPASNAAIVVVYDYWTGLPTVAGKDGKSAFQAAVSGGYVGTETAFNTALASIANKQSTINVNGILKGTGGGNVSTAVAGVDYVVPAGIVAKANQLTDARNIIIGKATKSFDGTTNINYTLNEIGAAAIDHEQAANTITAGTLAGQIKANSSAVSALSIPQIRNIYAGTTDMVAGVTHLATGDIYIYYEV